MSEQLADWLQRHQHGLALRWTHHAVGTITIAARHVSGTDLPAHAREGLALRRAYVMFEVADTGLGIDPAGQARIFERFYRVQTELTLEAGGTGLGLAFAQPLIRHMGGRLWLDSTPGQGSTFAFALPAAV